MDKKSHTPGPWRATATRVIASETEDRLGFDVRVSNGNAADTRANARLMAASPDLLASLERISRRYASLVGLLRTEYGDHGSEWEADDPELTQARAAIAKATGVQP